MSNPYGESSNGVEEVMGLSAAIVAGAVLIVAGVWGIEKYRLYNVRKRLTEGFYEEQEE